MCPRSYRGPIDRGLLLSLCVTGIMECAQQCEVFASLDKNKRTSSFLFYSCVSVVGLLFFFFYG